MMNGLRSILLFVVLIVGIDEPHHASAWSPQSVAMTSAAVVLWRKPSSKTTHECSSNDTETTSSTTIEQSAESTTSSTNSTTTTTSTAYHLAEKSSSMSANQVLLLSSPQLQSALAVFGGTVLTYYLHNCCNICGRSSIRASSLVGLGSALLLPLPLALASFCGSFAGMAKTTVIPNLRASLVLGVICAAMMALFDRQKWLMGIGGRLGFIAQCACTLQFIGCSLWNTNHPVASGAALVDSFGDPIKVLRQLPLVCMYTVLGALLMSLWKEAMIQQLQTNKDDKTKVQIYQRLSNSVAAASLTGLLAAGVFPATIAGPTFCGSIIAMSSPTKVETYGGLIGASILGGVCQQAMSGLFIGGWGGRLGTASVLGVLSYRLVVLLSKKTLRAAAETA